jgi:hypothetical protein
LGFAPGSSGRVQTQAGGTGIKGHESRLWNWLVNADRLVLGLTMSQQNAVAGQLPVSAENFVEHTKKFPELRHYKATNQ